MTWFLGMFARLGGLGAGAMLIPGVGPVVGILSSLFGLLCSAAKAVFDGFTIALANPVVFALMAAVFAGGVYEGIRWDAAKVRDANAKLSQMRREWETANAAAEARLAEAMAARETAEKTAARANRALARVPASDGVRNGNAKPPTPAKSGSSLPWFSGVVGSN